MFGIKFETILERLRRNELTECDLSSLPRTVGVEEERQLEEFIQFTEVLKHNTSLRILNLSHINIGPEKAKQLAEALEHNTSLLSLNISRNNIGIEGLRAIAQILSRNTTLQCLDLSYNILGKKGGQILSNLLSQNTTIVELNLASIGLGVRGIQALKRSLGRNRTLTSLNLSHQNIGVKGINILQQILRQNQTIQGLDFSRMNLGDRGFKSLTRVLKTHHSLTAVNLTNNGITTKSAQSLSEIVATNPILTELNLSENNLGTPGIKILAPVLARNRTLQRLNLTHNNLTEEGEQILSNIFQQNASIAIVFYDQKILADKIFECIQNNNLVGLRELVTRQQADVHARSSYTSSPLREALKLGYFAICEFLLEAGANIDDTYSDLDGTLLSQAVKQDDLQKVKWLVEHGADINAHLQCNETSLHLACQKGSIQIVTYFLENGADIHATTSHGQSPLHTAMHWCKSPEIIKLLLTHGADLHLEDHEGKTPLHIAAKKQSSRVVRLLLEQGANVHTRIEHYLSTPLHAAVSAEHHGLNPITIRLLIDGGCALNARNRSGETPLHLAALHSNREAVALLLNFGADVNARTYEERFHSGQATPWNFLVNRSTYDRENEFEVASLLLQAGADPYLLTHHHFDSTQREIARIFEEYQILQKDLCCLFLAEQENPIITDLTIECEGQTFYAHQGLMQLRTGRLLKRDLETHLTLRELKIFFGWLYTGLAVEIDAILNEECQISWTVFQAHNENQALLGEILNKLNIQNTNALLVDLNNIMDHPHENPNFNTIFIVGDTPSVFPKWLIAARSKMMRDMLRQTIDHSKPMQIPDIEISLFNCVKAWIFTTRLPGDLPRRECYQVIEMAEYFQIDSNSNFYKYYRNTIEQTDDKELIVLRADLCQLFLQEQENPMVSDLEIEHPEQAFRIHRGLMQLRIGRIIKRDLEEQLTLRELKIFFGWLYAGLAVEIDAILNEQNTIHEQVLKQSEENEALLREIFEKLNIAARNDLISDLAFLMRTNSPEEIFDFSIIVQGQKIHFPKWLLVARSGLMRGLDLSEAMSIQDQSSASIEVFEAFREWLCIAETDYSPYTEGWEELVRLTEYYQTNLSGQFHQKYQDFSRQTPYYILQREGVFINLRGPYSKSYREVRLNRFNDCVMLCIYNRLEVFIAHIDRFTNFDDEMWYEIFKFFNNRSALNIQLHYLNFSDDDSNLNKFYSAMTQTIIENINNSLAHFSPRLYNIHFTEDPEPIPVQLDGGRDTRGLIFNLREKTIQPIDDCDELSSDIKRSLRALTFAAQQLYLLKSGQSSSSLDPSLNSILDDLSNQLAQHGGKTGYVQQYYLKKEEELFQLLFEANESLRTPWNKLSESEQKEIQVQRENRAQAAENFFESIYHEKIVAIKRKRQSLRETSEGESILGEDEFFMKELLSKSSNSQSEVRQIGFFREEMNSLLIKKLINSLTERLGSERVGEIYSYKVGEFQVEFQVNSVIGDGNCLFYAVLGASNRTAQHELRQLVVEHQQEHSAYFESIFAIEGTAGVERDGVWGGQEELFSLVSIFGRPIIVLTSRENAAGITGIYNQTITGEEAAGDPIFILYDGHVHYDALESTNLSAQEVLNLIIENNFLPIHRANFENRRTDTGLHH